MTNGRALCMNCNLRKGERMVTQELREWQVNAKAMFLARRNKPDHNGTTLIHATMGAGKTRFACQIAADMLFDRAIRRVVVVTTGRTLCASWVSSAHKLNIELESNWSLTDGPPPANFQGLAITYAKLCTPGTSEFLRRWCTDQPTLVIFDEPHHLADATEASWGPQAVAAFAPTKERLLITGTPWRSDGTKIPFVKYGDDGFVECDYRYSYSEALRDGICRFVFFPTVDGKGRYGADGDIYSFESLRNTTEKDIGKVLSTIFQAEGGWLRETLNLAHKELMEMRANAHADAGGLIVVRDTEQAARVVKVMRSITRGEVMIATSKEEENGTEVIERFRTGVMPWLVAVQMVSEGVDIPRLRVGVYATPVRTRLAFRQFIGRFVRVIDGMEDQHAVVFIPWIDPYMTFAHEIEEEKLEALREEPIGTSSAAGSGDNGQHTFNPLSSIGVPQEIIAGPDSFHPHEEEMAQEHARALGMSIPGKLAALLIRRATGAPVGATSASTQGNQQQAPQTESESKRRASLRKEASKLQRRLAYMRSSSQASNAEFQAVGMEIVARFNVKRASADPRQLQAIIDWLLQELHAARRAA